MAQQHSPVHADTMSLKDEKYDEVEVVEELGVNRPQKYYEPSTQEEKALDKSLNLKLDFFVITLLAMNFLVRAPTFLNELSTY